MDPVIEQAIRRECESELTKADLEQVTSLYLDDEVDGEVWDIEDINLEDLAKLPKLTELGLDYQITDAGLKEVAKLQQLSNLQLAAAQITDAGLKELVTLTKLTVLELRYTKVTKAGVAELKEALPKCEIRSNPTK